jgi:hypothetical protein
VAIRPADKNAMIHVYDKAGSLIQTHEEAGDFKGGEFLLALRRSFR